MGYNFTIGNAKMEFDKEYSSLEIIAESKTLENAPAFNEPTDYSNERWPSYTQWADFSRFVGLYALFYEKQNDNCLILSHPGYVVLNEEIKITIDKAYAEFYEKYPNCKPGYSPKIDGITIHEDHDWPIENAYAVRLEWLKFWVDWVLENCEIPIFYNS